MSTARLCGTCLHFTRKGATVPGTGLCTQEFGPYRMARHFDPSRPCNKNAHQPIQKGSTPCT